MATSIIYILARPKRRTQNVRAGTRVPNAGGVLVVSWIPEASQSFFCSLQKGSAVSHRIFPQCFKVFCVISTTIKLVRGQNLFLSEKKRIREGKLTCPTSLVRPEPFLLHPKKDPELGRSTFWWLHTPFWAHKSSQNPFLFGGKKVSVSRPRK